MPAALEEYAYIIDCTVNNRLFLEYGGVHVVDVPLGAVLVLLQELLHDEKNPEEHIEPGGVGAPVEEREYICAHGDVVAAGAWGRGGGGGGGAVVLVAVERDGRGAAGGDLGDDPAHQPSDPVEEGRRFLLPPPPLFAVERRHPPPLLPPRHDRPLRVSLRRSGQQRLAQY